MKKAKPQNYTCKDCQTEIWRKAVSPMLVDLKLCPQCYSKRLMAQSKS